MEVVKTSSKGQVVIPAGIRRKLGLAPGDRVTVELRDGEIVVRPLPRHLVEALTGCLAEGASLTEALAEEHRQELEHDERLGP